MIASQHLWFWEHRGAVNEQSSVRQGVLRVVHFLRLRGPLSSDPTARTLHALVLALTIWSAVWTLATLPSYPNLTARLLRLRFIFVADLIPLATLLLLRFGYFRQAAYVYMIGQWAQATYNIAIAGSIQITSTAFYITLPILASWLLGFSEAAWTAGICLGTALILTLRQGPNNILPTAPPRPPLLIWANLVQLTLTAAAPVAHTLQTLQQYRQGLEQLVEKRTAELVEARDQALAANRSKSTFLAHMSHELRTPLNAILGFAGLVRRRASLSQQDREDLDVVERSGEILLGLIDEVLDTAKIETGRVNVESALIDIHQLVNETTIMLRQRARAKGLHLLLEISPNVPQWICSDAGKLRHVLINLVGNAVKYTEDGRVIVSVDCRADGNPRWRTLILGVEDTGIGIAPEDQTRIFEQFVQAGMARHTEGAGLGLSITRNFVHLLGGTIRLESSLGKGSRFCVEVPVLRVEAVRAMTEDENREQVFCLEPGQPDARILIVEDQKENWILLQRLLQEAGFPVRVAENGAQAIEAFRVWRPHFIWMDLRLPVMGGVETAERIRDLDGGREVKIVAMTASAFASEREEVLAAGFDGFVRKPYRRQEIFTCIARHIGVRYVHEPGPERAGDDLFPLRPGGLEAIPEHLREELESAVTSLNAARIMAAVSLVSEHDATVGKLLGQLAGRYKYTMIMDGLRQCRAKTAAAGS
jgi:signal transduction histidine kinase/DNA-binding NarL/FixJ family response regulator